MKKLIIFTILLSITLKLFSLDACEPSCQDTDRRIIKEDIPRLDHIAQAGYKQAELILPCRGSDRLTIGARLSDYDGSCLETSLYQGNKAIILITLGRNPEYQYTLITNSGSFSLLRCADETQAMSVMKTIEDFIQTDKRFKNEIVKSRPAITSADILQHDAKGYFVPCSYTGIYNELVNLGIIADAVPDGYQIICSHEHSESRPDNSIGLQVVFSNKELDNNDIMRASVKTEPGGILIAMSDTGKQKLASVIKEKSGQNLALIIGDQVFGITTAADNLSTSNLKFSCQNDDEAYMLSILLNNELLTSNLLPDYIYGIGEGGRVNGHQATEIVCTVETKKLSSSEIAGAVSKNLSTVVKRISSFDKSAIRETGVKGENQLRLVIGENSNPEIIRRLSCATGEFTLHLVASDSELSSVLGQIDARISSESSLASLLMGQARTFSGLLKEDNDGYYVPSINYKQVKAILDSNEFLSIIPKGYRMVLGWTTGTADVQRSPRFHLMRSNILLDCRYIEEVSLEKINDDPTLSPKENYTVKIRFSQVGSKLLKKITGDNVGARLGVVVDNLVYDARIIQECNTNGELLIHNVFSEDEIKGLTIILDEGCLTVPQTIVSSNKINW